VTTGSLELILRPPALVVLIGAAGAGKTTLAARLFGPDEVLSSDQLRATVSGDPADQRATRPAFAILHREAGRRLAEGRLVVVDATSVEQAARRSLLKVAASRGISATAIVLALPAALVHARNEARPGRRVPRDVVERHLRLVASIVAGGDAMAEETLRAEAFAAAVIVHSDADLARLRVIRAPAVSPR
jgi:protein phosphatase